MTGRPPGALPSPGWAVVAALIGIYIVSQFLRNAVGVIAPDLARDLAIQPQALGVLSSAFFLSFALAQIPVGAAIDRFGPKRTLLGSLVLAIAGAWGFAQAQTLGGMVLARVAMGLGCSTFYVVPLAIYAREFPPQRFASLAALQVGTGSLGALAATAPLGMVAQAWGWRVGFEAVAGFTLLAGAVVASVVRDAGDVHGERAGSLRASLAGFGEVLRTPGVGPLAVMNLISYSSFASVLGLWGGPLLADVYGLDAAARGRVLFVMAGAQIASIFCWGALDRFGWPRKPVVLGSAALGVAALVALGASVGAPLVWITLLLALQGVAAGTMPILTSHGKELFPSRLMGRGLTLLNMLNVGGVFVVQTATAAVLERWGSTGAGVVAAGASRPPEAYRAMLWTIAAALALAACAYARAPETRAGPPRT